MLEDTATLLLDEVGISVDSLRRDLRDLRSQAAGTLDPRGRAALRLIGEGLEILDHLVAELPEEAEEVAAPPPARRLPRPVDLSPVIDRAQRELQELFEARGIRFRRGGLPVVWGREEELRSAFRGWLENAALRMGNAAEREIEIQARTDRGHAIIALLDTGRGNGGRLPLVRAVVEAHGGSIRVEPALEGGTMTYLTLPLA